MAQNTFNHDSVIILIIIIMPVVVKAYTFCTCMKTTSASNSVAVIAMNS